MHFNLARAFWTALVGLHLAIADVSLPSVESPLGVVSIPEIATINMGSSKNLSQLIEGDIVPSSSSSLTRSAVCDTCALWPVSSDGLYHVPVEISTSFTSTEVSVIRWAFDFLESLTNVRFPTRSREVDYVSIINNGGGCYSSVGRQGGKQDISLDRGCVYRNTAIHETMHALGFGHEHQRSDRDNYVEIDFKSVCPNAVNQLVIQRFLDVNKFYYDYASVLHYGHGAFACPSNATTISAPKGIARRDLAGVKAVASSCDLASINDRYPGVATGPACQYAQIPQVCNPTTACEDSYNSSSCVAICNAYCELFEQSTSRFNYCTLLPINQMPAYFGALSATPPSPTLSGMNVTYAAEVSSDSRPSGPTFISLWMVLGAATLSIMRL